MRIGMMWQDKRLSTNPTMAINEAIDYYRAKYGREPNLVTIHPSHDSLSIDVVGITIEISKSVMPNHIWVGVED